MRFHLITRKTHYWLAAAVALPIVVMAGSGLLFHWEKQLSWVQPPERTGSGGQPALSFARMLEICRGIPQAQIQSWEDVNRIDVRPDRGMLKIWRGATGRSSSTCRPARCSRSPTAART